MERERALCSQTCRVMGVVRTLLVVLSLPHFMWLFLELKLIEGSS